MADDLDSVANRVPNAAAPSGRAVLRLVVSNGEREGDPPADKRPPDSPRSAPRRREHTDDDPGPSAA